LYAEEDMASVASRIFTYILSCLLMNSVEPIKKKDQRERRCYPRFRVKNGALAFLGAVPGEIADIGLKGMSMKYVPMDKVESKPLKIDIFVPEQDFYLPGLSCRLVSAVDIPADAPFQVVRVKRLSLEFCELSEEQQAGLQYFFQHNTYVPASA
jgi:hypothetical protein